MAKKIEWTDIARHFYYNQEPSTPEDLKGDCPQCGVGYGYPCLTKSGNWALHTHKKRLTELACLW